MLSRVSLGRGNSPPARTSSTYHSGSSRHTVCTSVIIPATCRFFNYFLRFSPVFAHFCTIFCIFGPLAPPAGRNWEREDGNRAPGTTNPLGGGEKNHAPGGEPGRAQHSAGAGDGLAPPSQGRSAAQRQRGGTRRAGGGDRRERAADRRQGSTAARAASGRGGPPQRGDALPAKKGGALRRPAAYRRCPARLCRTGQAGGGCGPPQSAEPAGPNAATPPRDGGGPPPPGPTLQVCTGAANNALAPWPQVADGGIA